jgi:hypothetical protein
MCGMQVFLPPAVFVEGEVRYQPKLQKLVSKRIKGKTHDDELQLSDPSTLYSRCVHTWRGGQVDGARRWSVHGMAWRGKGTVDWNSERDGVVCYSLHWSAPVWCVQHCESGTTFVPAFRMFKSLDKDGSGAISRSEMEIELKKLAPMAGPKAIDELFSTFDKDCSNSIDEEEFIAMCR